MAMGMEATIKAEASDENPRRIPAELEMMEKNFAVTSHMLSELENRLALVTRPEQDAESKDPGGSVPSSQSPLTHTLQHFRELQLAQHRKLDSIMSRLEA